MQTVASRPRTSRMPFRILYTYRYGTLGITRYVRAKDNAYDHRPRNTTKTTPPSEKKCRPSSLLAAPTHCQSMAPAEYKGGCHCGFVRYAVTLDLDPGGGQQPTGVKCSCSFCTKANLVSVRLAGPHEFRLVSPASRGALGDYTFGRGGMHHFFCRTCGIHCFLEGDHQVKGTTVPHMTVNVVTLDCGGDSGVDLRTFKMKYYDGRRDNWAAGQRDEPWEGGTY